MPVTEEEVCDWTCAFCDALDGHDGEHTLLDYLDAATQQQGNSEFRQVLEGVCDSVSQGYPLSGALSLYPQVFGEAYVVTVRYGEIYSELDVALRRYVERPEDRAARCRLPGPPPS